MSIIISLSILSKYPFLTRWVSKYEVEINRICYEVEINRICYEVEITEYVMRLK